MAVRSAVQTVQDIWSYRTFLLSEITGELKQSAANSPLGYLWWFLEPLAMMLVFYFVIGVVFQRGGENYLMVVLTGLVGWQWFARTISASTTALTRARAFILSMRFPVSILIASRVTVNLVYTVFGFAVVVVLSLAPPPAEVLYLPLILACQFLLMFGLGVILAVANVYVRDVERMVPVVLRAMWFLSPVFYQASDVLDSTRVPDWGKTAFMMNPLSQLLTDYRAVLLEGNAPDLAGLALWAAVGLVLAALGGLMLKRADGRLAKLV